MLTAKCINSIGFEWLLGENVVYNVLSWTSDTVVVVHPECGFYGMDRDRFIFNPSPLNHKVINLDDYKRFGLIRYLNSL